MTLLSSASVTLLSSVSFYSFNSSVYEYLQLEEKLQVEREEMMAANEAKKK